MCKMILLSTGSADSGARESAAASGGAVCLPSTAALDCSSSQQPQCRKGEQSLPPQKSAAEEHEWETHRSPTVYWKDMVAISGLRRYWYRVQHPVPHRHSTFRWHEMTGRHCLHSTRQRFCLWIARGCLPDRTPLKATVTSSEGKQAKASLVPRSVSQIIADQMLGHPAGDDLDCR